MENLNTFDFLEEVFYGNISENEIMDFIEENTKNYQLDRVKNLRKSIGQLKGRLLLNKATTNFYHLDTFEDVLVLEASKRNTNSLKPKKEEIKNDTPVSLEDMFKDKSQYSKIFGELVEYEILKRDGEKYSLNMKDVRSGLRLKRSICALGYLLDTNNYLKAVDETEIAAALSQLFNVEIPKATYSNAKKQCFENTHIPKAKAHDYFALFHCQSISKPKLN